MGSFEIREDTRVEEALADTQFVPGFDVSTLGLAYQDGASLDMLARETGEGVEIVGWHIPYPPSFNPPWGVANVTNLTDLPPERQNIDTAGKGVGGRLHNTWEASLGSTDGFASLYACSIDPFAIHDARRSSDRRLWGRALRVAEHLGKTIFTAGSQARLNWVVEQVHLSYGGADAAVWNQPPSGVRHQRKQGATREILPSSFAIIRKPGVLRLVGMRNEPYTT